jgi:hypothetical protein
MMTVDERTLIKTLIEKVNNLEKRLALQEQVEQAPGTFTTEQVQDAAFSALTDTATVDFTYNDGANQVTADVINDSITFAKMQNIATDSLIGRDTASTGDPENITLNATLSMDGSGNLQRAALTGDVTASAGSNATTIAANAVTNAKAAQMAANTVKSNITGSTANAADNDIATVLAQYIHAATGKTTPIDADELPLIDSAASNVLKKLTWANLKATIKTYYDSLATTLTNKTLDSTNIASLTSKTTPVDADSVVIVDSAASNVFKAVTGTNLKAYLKTYFDTLYGLLAGNNTWTGTQTINNSVAIVHTASALQVNRTTSSTTALRALAGFLLNSSGSTADGCGPAFFFQLADAESPSGNTIGEIGAVRAGADDTGDLVLVATASGVAVEVCRALHGGQLAVGLTSVNANILGIEAGTSSNDAAVGGVLYVDSGTNANGTTVETDLSTYTVPANTLAVNNQSLEFEAYITLTNNANTKTIKLYFGTDTWTMPTIGGAASTLYVRGRIVRTGSATQDVFYTASLNNTAPTNVFSTATRTLSGTVVLKFTGQSNSASNDVKQELFIVKWSDSNV